jgi:RNA polymerase sigma factor for flagellar operon FliA
MHVANPIRSDRLSPEAVNEQWLQFRESRDANVRTRLIEHYLNFARMIAAKLYSLRFDNSVAFDDYLQYARTGLLEVIDRYEPSSGVPFEGFAIHRIRGAILNGLGSESELAAQRKAGLPSRIVERLESLTSFHAELAESDALGHWVETVVGMAIGRLLDQEPQEPADESAHANPYARVELLELRSRLGNTVGKLPAREADIIRLHYFEHYEFQWIAESLAITKGRVAQLHARALLRLRDSLKSKSELDYEL